ncbi:hypothetical protein [Propionicicella superfundia]|uniref:hypothetical protein n=1 Tax=Propionicicella superfundia TaxID=348582 RepID=UPI000417D4D9|nr:hypothetical protein [Propionicicella superfundia]
MGVLPTPRDARILAAAAGAAATALVLAAGWGSVTFDSMQTYVSEGATVTVTAESSWVTQVLMQLVTYAGTAAGPLLAAAVLLLAYSFVFRVRGAAPGGDGETGSPEASDTPDAETPRRAAETPGDADAAATTPGSARTDPEPLREPPSDLRAFMRPEPGHD